MKKNQLMIIALVVVAAAIIITYSLQRSQSGDVKIGILLGFTGPIESLAPDMAGGAEMAITEAVSSAAFMDGTAISPVRADSTCVDSAAASAAAERMVTSDRVNAIMGADCSGVTTAVLQNVAMANGIVMISPSATSPALSTLEDNDLFFRTAPSDARQGEVIADILKARGFSTAAISYTNNDYGKGLADSIAENFDSRGGSITISASHEDGKSDYSSEVAALAQAGGDILIVAGYLDQGGKGIIQTSLDAGAFETFFLPDGMIGDSILTAIGSPLNTSLGSVPGTDSPGAATFATMANDAGLKGDNPFVGESYDAAALIILAMQAAGSTDSQVFKSNVMDVANAPGEKIYPGELGKALQLISEGKDIDYVGATAVELVGAGESAGSYAELEVNGGQFVTVRYR